MPDWHEYVRQRLSLDSLRPERQERIMRELAAQLEDCYRESRARGLSHSDAELQVHALVNNWRTLGSAILDADSPHARGSLDRLSDRAGVQLRRHGAWGTRLADLQQDLFFSLRMLARRPLFFFVTVLTLGLGIGSTTTLFTFINGVLLKPLPYPESGQLVRVCEGSTSQLEDWCGGSPANLIDWRELSRTLETVSLARSWPFLLQQDDRSVQVQGGFAMEGLFELLGARPLAGRFFEESDSAPGATPVALVSSRFWRSRMGADREALGSILKTDQLEAAVVGVLPDGFEVPDLETVDLWVSFPAEWRIDRGWRGFRPFGRLAPAATADDARAEMSGIAAELARRYPEINAGHTIRVTPLHDSVVASVRQPLLLFMAATALILLIACANVASLLLVRTIGRMREFAVRGALGAGQGRVFRHFLAENALLALIGGAAGAAIAWWLTGLMLASAPPGLPRFDEVVVNGRVLFFAVAVSTGVCLFLGAIQAVQVAGINLAHALRTSGNSTATGNWFRSALVTTELGLALMLLAGAGLLSRSFFNLLEWSPGFEIEQITTAFVIGPADKYPQGSDVAALFQRAIEEVESLPGVVSASAASGGPLFGGGDGQVKFLIEGRPVPNSTADYPEASRFDVFPDYFETLGVALRAGRTFTDSDRAGTLPVAIVNEAAVRRYWPEGHPTGQRITLTDLGDAPIVMEVVGVVADVPPFLPDTAAQPEIYWPLAQMPRWGTMIVIRTDRDSAALVSSIENRLSQAEPDLQVGAFASIEDRVGRRLIRPRFFMLLMGTFALLAVSISAVGIYGVMSWSVAARTREIGTRLVLGASRSEVLRMVLKKGLATTLLGTVVGLAFTLGFSRMLTGLLVVVSPTDLPTLSAATLLLVLISLLACLIPARRATRVDPLTAIKLD